MSVVDSYVDETDLKEYTDTIEKRLTEKFNKEFEAAEKTGHGMEFLYECVRKISKLQEEAL